MLTTLGLPRIAFIPLIFLVLTLSCSVAADSRSASPKPTMASLVESSTAADWRLPDPEMTLYMDLPQGRVIIELSKHFASNHVANLKQLVRENYFDGLSILRIQDNYVAQWGDPNAEKAESARPVRIGQRTLRAEFERTLDRNIPFTPLPDGDVYAREVGWVDGFPVARDRRTGKMWLIHTYGMVGAGRDNDIHSGGGTELYAVIGHAPRQLDRNVTLFGKILRGVDLLSSLPRGTGPMGFYQQAEQRIPITRIRVAADLPATERTSVEVFRTDSPRFKQLIESRRNRPEEWFHHRAGRIEISNVPIPVRERK